MNPNMQVRLNTRTFRLVLGDDPLSVALRTNLEARDRVAAIDEAANVTLRSINGGARFEAEGMPPYVLSADVGGYCVHTPAGWIHTLPFAWTPRTGPIALITPHGRQTAWLAESLREQGREASIIATVGDGETIADWLDLAGRHEEISVIGIALTELDDPVSLGRVASAVSAHVPIVVWLPEALASSDPWLAQWLEDQGVLLVKSAGAFGAALTLLSDLNPPEGQRVALLVPDAATEVFLGGPLEALGLDVEVVQARDSATLEAIADTLRLAEHDLVVAVLEPGADATLAVDLGALREETVTPLVAVARGSYAWGRRLAGQLHAFGIPTLLADAPLAAGLRALWRWQSQGSEEGLSIQVTDQLRARRVLREMITDPSKSTDPAVHAELLAALAIPMARAIEVRHVDDALIAAAELGYPVLMAVRHDGLGWDAPWEWAEVDDADALEDIAHRQLARARQQGDLSASLVLRAQIASGVTFNVMLERHPVYGIAITVDGPASTLHVLPSTARDALGRFLRANGVPRTDHKSVHTSLIHVLGASNALMRFGAALRGIQIAPLAFHSGGALAGAALVALVDP